jgi:hypothetical protein
VVSVRTLRWRLDPYTLLAAIEATGAAVVCAIVSRALPGWESDALAILAWLIVFTMLAPAWSIALVRSLASRLSGARAPQTLEG